MDITIIKETDSYLLVWKSAGLPITPVKENSESLISELVKERPELMNVKGYSREEYGLLNRLDNQTAGIVIVARTQKAFEGLAEKLKKEQFVKIYLACCHNLGKRDKGIIDIPIAHHYTKKSRMVLVAKGTKFRGKPQICKTYYEKISCDKALKEWKKNIGNKIPFPDFYAKSGNIAWILCYITKGKRHQIRLHLMSAGYPIAGDALYGAKLENKSAPVLPGHALFSIGLREKSKMAKTFGCFNNNKWNNACFNQY